MAVHEGQLTLLELADAPHERPSRPRRAVRQAATPADKPTKSAARSKSHPSPKSSAGPAPVLDAALLTTDEAADLLHVHPRTVQRLVRRGELCAVHLGSA